MRRIRSRRFALLMVVMLLLTTLLQGGVTAVFANPGTSIHLHLGGIDVTTVSVVLQGSPDGDGWDPDAGTTEYPMVIHGDVATTSDLGIEFSPNVLYFIVDGINTYTFEFDNENNGTSNWRLLGTPGISLEKSVEPDVAMVGDVVVYTLTVSNTGETELDDIVITDTGIPEWSIPEIDDFEAKDQPKVFTYEYTVTGEEGDPFINVASLTASGGLTASASAELDIIHPDFTINKSVDKDMANPGDILTYTIIVENTGDVDLIDVNIVDPMFDLNETVTIPFEGQWEIEKIYTVPDPFDGSILSNTATATYGDEPKDSSVEVTITDEPIPSISIVKYADKSVVEYGDTVNFSITVENDGDLDLQSVVITDAVLDINYNVGNLAIGESKTITSVEVPALSVVITPENVNDKMQFENIAVVNAEDLNGRSLPSEEASAIVDTAGISIEKTADPTVGKAGDEITYTFAVTNTGSMHLHNIVITDPELGYTSDPFSLEPGATDSSHTAPYVLLAEDFIEGIFTNIATALGYYGEQVSFVQESGSVEDSDDAVVMEPAIDIVKSADKAAANVGDTVKYTFVVTNIGQAPLFGIIISDAQLNWEMGQEEAFSLGITEADDSVTITHDYIIQAGDFGEDGYFHNTATATGYYLEQEGATVSDESSAEVAEVVPGAAVGIVKSVNDTSVRTGTTVQYTIKVTNTGGVTLFDLLVKDVNLGFEQIISSLEPNGVQTFTIDKQLTTGDRNDGSSFVNTATVDVSRYELHQESSVSVLITRESRRDPDPTPVIEPEPIPEAVPEVIPAPVIEPEPEPVIFEEAIPLAVPVLPQTGELPPELFYGLGGMLAAIGVYLKRK